LVATYQPVSVSFCEGLLLPGRDPDRPGIVSSLS